MVVWSCKAFEVLTHQVARPEAHRLMLEVHEEGRSVVWSGARERAEGLAQELQRWHLRAHLESDA